MDWIYEKYLRNHELGKIENEYQLITDLVDTYGSVFISFIYPRRLGNKNLISLVPRFKRHPNSIQQMYI